MSAVVRSLIVLAVFIAPGAASAHPVFGGIGGFPGGLLHPLFVPAHLLAIVAVGVLIAQNASCRRWLYAIAFSAGLLAGFAAIASAYTPALTGETLLALAFIGGALVALAKPLPRPLIGLLTAATGIAIALDSPPDAISLREAALMQIGTFWGATILLFVIYECARRLTRGWQRVGVRILGSWIAASAVLVLALRLAK